MIFFEFRNAKPCDMVRIMSQNQNQTNEQSYLNVPHASVHLEKADNAVEQVRDAQVQVVNEMVSHLSRSNPTVSFNLDRPLDQSLYNELVRQGYAVAHQSSYQNLNGEESTNHKVQVSLPGVVHHHRQVRNPWSLFYMF